MAVDLRLEKIKFRLQFLVDQIPLALANSRAVQNLEIFTAHFSPKFNLSPNWNSDINFFICGRVKIDYSSLRHVFKKRPIPYLANGKMIPLNNHLGLERKRHRLHKLQMHQTRQIEPSQLFRLS